MVIPIVTIYFIGAAFTGSSLSPIHMAGSFTGLTSFSYTAANAENQTDEATVFVRVGRVGEDVAKPDIIAQSSSGFVKDNSATVRAWRSGQIKV